jgi:hypothetical protein
MQVWLPRILVAFHRLLVVAALLCLAVGAFFNLWAAVLAAASFYLAGVVALMTVYLLAWWVLGAFSPSKRKLRFVSFPPRGRRTSPALAR